MKPEQYRPIIKKTLEDAKGGSFASIDKLCDHLIGQMDIYEQMVGLAAQIGVAPPVAVPVPVINPPMETNGVSSAQSNVIITDVRSDVDVTRRMGSKPAEDDGRIREYRTKQELYDYYKTNLPPKFDVTPPGFADPLPMQLTMMMSPDPMTAIKIKYSPPGSNDDSMSAITQVSTTDRDLDPDRILSDIKKQAEGIFRPAVKQVIARQPPPKEALFAGGGVNALSASTDRDVSESDIQHWNKYAGRPQI